MAGGGWSHSPIEVDLINTEYRRINTAIPVPESIAILKKMKWESHDPSQILSCPVAIKLFEILTALL